MTLFVSGYLMVMAKEKYEIKANMIQHLQELMDNVESYGLTPSGCTMLKMHTGKCSAALIYSSQEISLTTSPPPSPQMTQQFFQEHSG